MIENDDAQGEDKKGKCLESRLRLRAKKGGRSVTKDIYIVPWSKQKIVSPTRASKLTGENGDDSCQLDRILPFCVHASGCPIEVILGGNMTS